MISTVIAKRYADAILALAAEQGAVERSVADFQALAATYGESAELRHALEDPQVSMAVRKAILEDLGTRLGLQQHSKNALFVLVDHRRLRLLPEVARALVAAADERSGLLRGEVRSAAPLSEAYVAQLTSALEKRFQKKVVLTRSVDPSLVSGVVARVGDTIIDGSLKTSLLELKRELLS